MKHDLRGITTHPFTSIYALVLVLFWACNNTRPQSRSMPASTVDSLGAISKPLISHLFTADPSAHVFDGKIYIYPSHDYEAGVPADDQGSHFAMRDYHVFSMVSPESEVTDHGIGLNIKDVPWAKRQMWAPDAAFKDGRYYLYFPAKDHDDVFRIGVAVSSSPAGPFEAHTEPISGSYSIDPAVFRDDDDTYYLYFGGIWGGQLQRWSAGTYDPDGSSSDLGKPDTPAISPRVARLTDDMLQFAEPVREVSILDEAGRPVMGGDHDRRFFEAAWVHKYQGTYYFSYSTGNTHFIVYATGDNPYGPFTYQGVILNPVLGWTTHHSILEFEGKWYLFYHDSELSGGKTHLRNVKMTELTHQPDESIQTIDPYRK